MPLGGGAARFVTARLGAGRRGQRDRVGLTLSQVGRVFGVSGERVRQWQQKLGLHARRREVRDWPAPRMEAWVQAFHERHRRAPRQAEAPFSAYAVKTMTGLGWREY